MLTQLGYLWRRIDASFWFVPICLLLAAIVSSTVLLVLDSRYSLPWLADPKSPLHLSSEGSRQLLGVIAGSMVSVASLVFSITLIVLQLASSQFGPRLITRFMGDKVNQMALGTFIATFLYALLVLRSIEGGDSSFVPQMSVLGALVLAVVSLGWLIYFIHHTAESIQADTVVADVTDELRHAIGGRFPQADLPETQVIRTRFVDARPPEPASTVDFTTSGYVQVIDVKALLALAERHELRIDVLARPGQFAIPGTAALEIRPVTALDRAFKEAALEAVILNYRRTPHQDIEFAFSSLVSIALRALSPAMNDPITAATCIDRLTAAIALLMASPPPPQQITDEAGRLRLVVHPVTLAEIVGSVFMELIAGATAHASVLLRLAGSLTILGRLARIDLDRDALRAEAARLRRVCERTLEDEGDLAMARDRLADLDAVLADPRS